MSSQLCCEIVASEFSVNRNQEKVPALFASWGAPGLPSFG